MRLKEFLVEEDGMGTAEVVIIAAVLVAIALLFKNKISIFVKTILDEGFKTDNVLDLAEPGGVLISPFRSLIGR